MTESRQLVRRRHRFTSANIMIITPYNVQVNSLQSFLPADAQCGHRR